MEYYEKEQFIFDFNESEKQNQLIQSILDTREALKRAHINFELAESGLIDFYTYEIKANQAKLDYLIRIAKSKKITISRISNKAG